jgi:hypothetical protein
MATVKPIEPEKPVDLVAYEPVMLALSKARAAQYLLKFLDSEHSEPLATFKMQEPKERVTEHLGWIRQFGHDALVAALDEAEAAYRKLGTEGRRLV